MPKYIRSFFRCETIQDCEDIQRGNPFIKRLSKWYLLFSIAFTLFLSDCLNFVISSLIHASEQTSEAFKSIPLRWFYTPPQIDQRLIRAWSLLGWLELVILVIICALAIRWTYADCRVRKTWPPFKFIMVSALVTNTLIYFSLHAILQSWWH